MTSWVQAFVRSFIQHSFARLFVHSKSLKLLWEVPYLHVSDADLYYFNCPYFLTHFNGRWGISLVFQTTYINEKRLERLGSIVVNDLNGNH